MTVNQPSTPYRTFAEDNNEFALAMYEILRQRPGNVFFSPLGIRAALGMAYAGAKGETAAQMREALRMTPPDEKLHVDFARFIQRLKAEGIGEYEMELASSLWCQDGLPLQPGFLDVIVRHYGGGADLLDFRHLAEAARRTINQWAEDKTRRKVRDLIPPGGVNGETRMVLANAIYFKGKWVLPFREMATRDEPFHQEGGGTVNAPLMRQERPMDYLQAPGYQAVDLRYSGSHLSMLVLLPDRKDGLED